MAYKENEDMETLIETRGEGGFIITAPSHGTVNPDGDYKLKYGGLDSIPSITPEERQQLFDVAKSFNVSKNSTSDSIQGNILDVVKNITVFRDEKNDPFAFHNGNCYPLKSKDVKAHIIRLMHDSSGKPFKDKDVAEALATLECKAITTGDKITLHNRVAWQNNRIMYDLGNGKAVKIGPRNWKTVNAPILFRRYSHQQVQCDPISGGNPWMMFKYMNIPEKYRLETFVLLVSCLVPDIAHPIFHPHGAHGSGKTTLCKLIKRLIDPSCVEVIIAPKNKVDLISQIHRHHLPLFDNMSKLDGEMSDILCMACTGGSFAKRALYTDDDEIIFNLKRCVGINGINLLITKPDLLDRTMLLNCERITSEQRKREADLLKDFDEVMPEILGGMFDILSKAMAIHPQVDLDELPRMADFATWGYAIAEALGTGRGTQFIADYQSNIKRQNAEVLQHSSLCLAVTQFMRDKKEWEGTVKGAYLELHSIAEPSKADSTFPNDPKNLRRYLERIQTTLAESEHITYTFSDRPKKDGYHVEFRRKA